MKNYRKVETGSSFIVFTDEKGNESWIPCDESNSDYQRYLRWLEDPTADEAQSL